MGRKYPDLPPRNDPEYQRLYYEKNKGKISKQIRDWKKKKKEADPSYDQYDPIRSAKYRETNRKRYREHNWKRHGIIDFTHEQYLEELDRQQNRCKICGNDMKMPQVDHDHETGKFRALLCKPCNFGLGIYEKNHTKFAAYLEDHKKLQRTRICRLTISGWPCKVLLLIGELDDQHSS